MPDEQFGLYCVGVGRSIAAAWAGDVSDVSIKETTLKLNPEDSKGLSLNQYVPREQKHPTYSKRNNWS